LLHFYDKYEHFYIVDSYIYGRDKENGMYRYV